MTQPASELAETLSAITPGRALDLACGSGRHTIWLRDRGWEVTAVDREGEDCIHADLEQGEFVIEPNAWDLIVCWLYWQENLLPSIAAGVKPGGIAALAGKRTGRFATSLANYRAAFEGWEEIAAGEDDYKAFLITQRLRQSEYSRVSSSANLVE